MQTENGDVMRDKNGLCVLCKPGEPFMHLSWLKVTVKLKGTKESIMAFSNVIWDKNRYEIKVGLIRDNQL